MFHVVFSFYSFTLKKILYINLWQRRASEMLDSFTDFFASDDVAGIYKVKNVDVSNRAFQSRSSPITCIQIHKPCKEYGDKEQTGYVFVERL
jgi:hypothetical protein